MTGAGLDDKPGLRERLTLAGFASITFLTTGNSTAACAAAAITGVVLLAHARATTAQVARSGTA